MRSILVIGSSSAIGNAVVAQIRANGDIALGVDTHGCDITVDFSNTTGRLEGIESVLEKTGNRIDAVISVNNTTAKKPVAISANFFGITQFIEGLYDELKDGISPRISILNYYDECDEISLDLVNAMLHSGEKFSLKLAQQLTEQFPDLAGQNYSSSQKALQIWVREMALKSHWKLAGILMNTVTADKTVLVEDVADILVWLASGTNTSHTGEVFSAKDLTMLRADF